MSNNLTNLLLSMENTEQTRDKYLRAPMGYPGSKSRSLPHLLPHLPYRNTFVDVCGGSGSVLLARKPCKLEVFNDRNAGIVSFYRCLRDPDKCKRLSERVELSPPLSREEFIWCRDTWKCDQLDDVERGARWYYAIVSSFGQKGWAYGRAVKGTCQGQKLYNNLKAFWSIHNRIKNIQIENLDWRQVLKDYAVNGHDVVWYIDPPYWGTTGVYDYEWKKEEHYELCERIKHLHGYVALSGYDCPEHPYNKFHFWTEKVSWEVHVSMTSQAFTETNNLSGLENVVSRGLANETLWIYKS